MLQFRCIAVATVAFLKDQKNDEFAKIIFDPAFEVVRAMLAENPDSPEVLNNIAWLAARCAMHCWTTRSPSATG